MTSPRVTELPRNLEPVTDDTFMQGLDERRVPRSEPALSGGRPAARPPADGGDRV